MTRRGKIRTATFALAAAAVFGVSLSVKNLQAMQAQSALSYVYQRAVNDLSGYVSGMESALEKARYANTATAQTAIAAQLLEESSGAKAALAALPVSGKNSSNINRFLSQAGDYASYLSRQLASGRTLEKAEFDNISTLCRYAGTLGNELEKLEERFRYERLTINETRAGLENISEVLPTYGGELEKNASAFGEYPTLIYDGPFSDHIAQRTAKATKGLARLSQKQAHQAAAAFLKTDSSRLKHISDTGGGLPCYNFMQNDTRISVTKDGGILCAVSNPREILQNRLSQKEALAKAMKFLNGTGISPVKESYYVIADGVCTFNFAFQEKAENDKKITCYPDLIKVGVALDNGEIVSYNAAGYLMNHHKRSSLVPKISAQEAQKSVSSHLKIQKEPNLTWIPTPGLDEVLCWEFVCKGDDNEDILLYINTKTGMEERIYQLIKSDSGILAI